MILSFIIHIFLFMFQETLNAFMSLPCVAWKEARAILQRILGRNDGTIRDNAELRAKALFLQKDVIMHLPATVGDYTDFYSSFYHASNVGMMFRNKDDPLLPNWLVKLFEIFVIYYLLD